MLKPAPQLEPQDLETIWWGDDAVDQDASKGVIGQWCQTGETDLLTMRAGVEPSTIRYRALTVQEVALLDYSERKVMSLPYQAARFGLLEIKGYPLQRVKTSGVRSVTKDALDQLTAFQAMLPIRKLHATWMPSQGYEFSDTSEEYMGELLACDLVQWIGGLILGATFRLGGGVT